MTLKLLSYLLPKPGNQLTKNMVLENKVFFRYFFSKTLINESWLPSLIFFKEKKIGQKNDFESTKLAFFSSADLRVLVRDMKAT